MKYFIDTEFIEEPGLIELISIGIVAEDGQEFYAISKEFNFKKVWNQFDWKRRSPEEIETTPALGRVYKDYWLRTNVLRPIFNELVEKDEPILYHAEIEYNFKKRRLKQLIRHYGESNEAIARQVLEFVRGNDTIHDSNPEFYVYYGDYDWVVFCWLFGRMIDLPAMFPCFGRDLKQMMVERNISNKWKNKVCPPPKGEHNALIDARWNKKLYNAIMAYDQTKKWDEFIFKNK